MTNEINGFRLRTLETPDSRSGKDTAKTRAADSGAPSPAAPTDSVSLTDGGERLKELTALLAGTPEVDSARVEELRKQIAEGRYQPDDVHVAEKLVALEKNLFGMDRH